MTDVPIRFIDDFGEVADNGDYIRLPVVRRGVIVEILMLTTTDFYAAFDKVLVAVMPAVGDGLIH